MKEFSIPLGMRDLVSDEVKNKKLLQLALEKRLDRWGYEEIVTPSIEYFQTYSAGFSDLQEEEMYKFFDSSGRILALRSDMTIPIARVAATKFKQLDVIRLRYCANVFKVHETLSGNRNELSDCGVELIGVDATSGDLEILVTALDALKVVGDINFTLEIGDIQFFQAALKGIDISEKQKQRLAYLVDHKSLTELKAYVEELELAPNLQAFFNQLLWFNGDYSILSEAKKYAFNQELIDIIQKLEKLYEQLSSLGYQDVITFDLGKVGNWNYYTGIIFDAFVEGVGLRVMSGGRYDTLICKYGRDLPAVGFSVKLDQLMKVVNLIKEEATVKIVYPETMVLDALRKRAEYKDKKIILKVDNSLKHILVKEEN